MLTLTFSGLLLELSSVPARAELGSSWNTLKIPHRISCATVVFKGKTWIIGGSEDGVVKNDVWWTNNGSVWTQTAASTAFPPRILHACTVFQDKIWLTGGMNGTQFYSDVWCSSDGITWIQVLAGAPYGGRIGLTLNNFDNKLWLIGGRDTAMTTMADIWTSPDGLNWTQLQATAPFGPRAFHGVVDYDHHEQLYLIGGQASATEYKNDVWTTVDGKSWFRETVNAEFSPRSQFGCVQYKDYMWVIGGEDASGRKKDVWCSYDGGRWVQTTSMGLPDNAWCAGVVMYGKLGMISTPYAHANIETTWSTDGASWAKMPTGSIFTQRHLFGATVFKNKMWVIGGWTPAGLKNDVWNSSDGLNWNPVTNSAQFSPRMWHQVLAFQNKLWLIGGFDGAHTNQVWNSPDGVNWTQVNPISIFSGRTQFTCLVYNDRIWVIGGWNGTVAFQEVWSSPDGINWTRATTAAAFAPRAEMKSVVFNGRMWISGGYDQGGSSKNDVWWSTDGTTWTQATPLAGFPVRFGHMMTVQDGRMWIMGGCAVSEGQNVKNDVWYSSNGVNWTQATGTAGFSPRYFGQCLPFANAIWVIGGREVGNVSKNDIWVSGINGGPEFARTDGTWLKMAE